MARGVCYRKILTVAWRESKVKQPIRGTTTQDGSRVTKTLTDPKQSAQDRTNLSEQMRLQKNRRQRTVRNALIWTSIAHLLAVLSLFYFIEPASKHFDEVIHVEMVNEVLEKREVDEILEQRKVIQAPPVETIKHAEVHADTARVAVKVPVILSVEGGKTPPIDTELDTLQKTALDIRTPENDSPVVAGAQVHGVETGHEGYRRGNGTGSGNRTGSGVGSGFDSFRGKGAATEFQELGTPKPDLVTIVDNKKKKLGAILEGTPQSPGGHIRIVRLKHSLSDWWQDPTAIPSFAKWLAENTQLRADMTFAGGSLALTDDRILDAPLVIMTGHDKDIHVGHNLERDGQQADGFTSDERVQLRRYIIEREGMLFFDDCGFNGNFAATAKNELQRTFPEHPLNNIDHTHELYTVYYQLLGPPRGGDVFWGNLNRGDSGGYYPAESQFRFQKGITINRRLAVLFNRKDYMCAMETAEVGSRALLQMRRSTDVYRFMTNMLIYQMRYGGNTDRSGFKR